MDSAMKSKVPHQSPAQASTRNLSAQAVTAAVIDRMKSSRSDRFKQVMASLIQHLHAFARDVQLSEHEWAFAIDFLTKTGQSCTRSRQEFILLSDTLGLSTLVTQMNHPSQGKETEQTVLGPFHRESAPQFPLGADIAAGIEGKPVMVNL
jgi:hydroxyquinol 1,2-dioxygenase